MDVKELSSSMVGRELDNNKDRTGGSGRLKAIASITGVCEKIDEYCAGNTNMSEEDAVKPKQHGRENVTICEIKYPSYKLSSITRKKNEILKFIDGDYYDENTATHVRKLEEEYNDRIAVFRKACAIEERKIEVDLEELECFIHWKEDKLLDMVAITDEIRRYMTKAISTKDNDSKSNVRPEDSVSQVSNKTENNSISVILKNKILQESFKTQTELKMMSRASLLKEKEIEAIMEFEKLKLKIETDRLRIECETDALRELEREYQVSELKYINKYDYTDSILQDDRRSMNNSRMKTLASYPGNYEDIIKTQNELTLSLIKAQAMACLPKNEPEKFSGEDITKYKSFILSFERIIEQRCTNEEDKFYYLLNYTRDQANELVQSCHTESAGGGYRAARNLLQKFYGNEYQIASKYLLKLKNWPQVKYDDVLALQELATYLTGCLKMMQHMTPLNQLNSWRDIHEVDMKLPYDLRKQFRKEAAIETKKNKDVTFETLVTFINDQVDILRFPILGDISDKKPSRSEPKYIKPTVKFDSFAINEDARSDEVLAPNTVMSEFVSRQCLCCKKINHTIDRCFFFLAKPLEERLTFVRRHRLCYGCLATSMHGSKNCPNKMKCKKCDQNHPTSLHRNTEETEIGNNAQRES